MNWGINALGQGNRANSIIGRALQLIVRNVGGGIPDEIDRATLGYPGKLDSVLRKMKPILADSLCLKPRGFNPVQTR